jgi:alpha-galactosidase
MAHLLVLLVAGTVPVWCGSGAAVAAGAPLAPSGGGLRGWNTWDGYIGPSNETLFLAGAQYLAATLLPFGYNLAVIDGGWYAGVGGNKSTVTLDAYGRPYPRADAFPSAGGGKGFGPIAAQVHALGLHFGVWTIRGIPKVAVDNKMPIAGSNFTADQAASSDANATLCTWNADNYGVAPNAAGAAYYASLAALYAAWGVDFVKIDCMVGDGQSGVGPQNVSGLYTPDFTLFAEAFGAAGITLSVSPGGDMNPQNGSYIASNALAAQYRVTGDFWDVWENNAGGFPSDLKSKFGVLADYAGLIGANNSFPDPDMLPLGVMYHAQKGPASPTRLTQDEQTTLVRDGVLCAAACACLS